MNKVDTTIIKLWDQTVGALAWLDDRRIGVFEYEPEFLKTGLDISPLHMGIEEARQGDGIFSFSHLNQQTYLGLPGLLADALPDKFGNNIIDAWLARNGRSSTDFSPIDRLCYTGTRGMGALEFFPPLDGRFDQALPVEISELVKLTQDVMSHREKLDVDIGNTEQENADAIMDILRVGTSAGGARAKAVIALNDEGHVLSGQADVPADYDYWLLKFDGVTDLELGKPKQFGRIEYAYYLMAKAAGIEMTECRLLEENGRAHFLTKRFDRQDHKKIHMQSLCGVAHFDYNHPGAYSYEQAFSVMRSMHLTKAEIIQQYKRMVFNVLARNQDDHTKNIAFLMHPNGQWQLSPAYDVTYSHNPAGKWTNQHQMTINGKRDQFTMDDLLTTGDSINISNPLNIIQEIQHAVEHWPEYAEQAGIDKNLTTEIKKYHRRY